MDNQWHTYDLSNIVQANQVQLRLPDQVTMYGANRHRQAIDTGRRNKVSRLLRSGQVHLSGMELRLLTKNTWNVAKFSFDQHIMGMRQIDYGTCGRNICREWQSREISHHPLTT